MKTANIATARNQLSRLLQRVKRGETVLITDRKKPVARLVPVQETGEVVSRLVAEGKLLPRKGPRLDVKAFLEMPRPKLSAQNSPSKAIMEERETGW